ncbi:hypothetical protein M9Y10_030165 [Tritrichomonas musculus]|uniref:Uncharacterized protein n=1 Tax=Tritrichomonas musculus TaxID=1915356 RepID=A0ABR2KP24_9EUKA
MIIVLTLLAIYKIAKPFEIRADDDSSDILCFLRSLDKIVNDGMTGKEFQECVSSSSNFIEWYGNIIDTASNESYILSEPFLEDDISSYFDLRNSILTLFPNISFFDENRELFQTLRPIITDLGPDLCNVLSLNYNTIINLYDYALINKDEDGIQFGKLFNILDLSSEWVPKVSKIIQFFDPANKQLSTFMEGMNVKKEYGEFITKVKSLKKPTNDQEKFFSVIKILDAISSGVDVFNGAYNNFLKKYTNEFIIPLIKTYLIKPINIFDRSIYERAKSLVNALVKFQDYPISCDKNPEQMTDLDKSRCQAFTLFINLIETVMPSTIEEDDDESGTEAPINISAIKDAASTFTNEEINLTGALLDFSVPENYIKFFFGSVANLTDQHKNYVDLLEGTNLLYKEKEEFRQFKDSDNIDNDTSSFPIHKYINNITNIIKFIGNLDDASNFKVLFEYLGIPQYWETFSKIMNEVNRDSSICDNILIDMMEIDNKTCLDMVNSFKKISDLMTTTKKLKDLLKIKNEPVKFVLDCLMPFFQELDIRVSLLINSLYRIAVAPIVNYFVDGVKLPKKVDYTNLVKSSGDLLTKTFTLFDDIIPVLIKKIPFIGDLITKINTKMIDFLSLLRDNVDVATFLEFFMGGSSVITKMLKSAANAYVGNDGITGADFAKAIQPTSFLNVYETSKEINGIKDMRFKNLAKAITFDGSSSKAKLLANDQLTFNDFIPFKSLVENSEDLSKSFNNNNLNLNIVAKSLGTGETDVKQSLTSLVQSALMPPADAIIASSASSGYDMDTILAYLNGIGEFSQKVARGELVKSKTNEYVQAKKKKLPIGAIIGIAVGCVVVVGVAVFLGVYFGVIRKRKQNDDKNEDTSPAAAKDDDANGDSI